MRAGGIEPPSTAWKAVILPLNYARLRPKRAPAGKPAREKTFFNIPGALPKNQMIKNQAKSAMAVERPAETKQYEHHTRKLKA